MHLHEQEFSSLRVVSDWILLSFVTMFLQTMNVTSPVNASIDVKKKIDWKLNVKRLPSLGHCFSPTLPSFPEFRRRRH
jgi:hypothetical protein